MATLTGQKINARYKDLLQVSNTNQGVDATMRKVSDGEATDSALSISTLGVQVDTTLTGAGDEGVLTLNYTANKPNPGNPDDVAILINCTDTASYGESDFIRGLRSGNLEFYVRNGSDGYAGVWTKTWNNAGRSYYHLAHNVSSNTWLQMFVNGTGTSNGLEAQDVGFLYGPDDNRGLKIFGSVPGSWCYGATVQHALKLGEQGGSHTVDAGLRRSAAGVVQVFNGNIASPSTVTLQAQSVTLDANDYQYADVVSVSDGVATDIFDITMAAGDMIGAVISYTITATASGEYQAHTGMVALSAVNKSGTITAAINEGVTEAVAVSTGSLTDTWTAVDGTGKVTVRCSANSSLTTPTMTLRYHLTLHASNALTKK